MPGLAKAIPSKLKISSIQRWFQTFIFNHDKTNFDKTNFDIKKQVKQLRDKYKHTNDNTLKQVNNLKKIKQF